MQLDCREIRADVGAISSAILVPIPILRLRERERRAIVIRDSRGTGETPELFGMRAAISSER